MPELLTRPLRAGQLTESPRLEQVVATAAERAALAAAYGLPVIAGLTGDFTLRHEGAGVVAASLHLTARLTQTCVVSLEPFETDLDERAELRFVPARSLRETSDIAELDDTSLDAPDELAYTDDRIDLGAALAEQLALALDPYPRKPGVALAAQPEADSHPFAALANLRRDA